MVDLKPLQKYILKDELDDYDNISKIVAYSGMLKWFEEEINLFLNCQRTFKDGRRCIQTNDYRYKNELTRIIAAIEACAENKDYYYEKLIEQHNSNLEFEAINGFEYDVKVKNKNKPTKSKNKQQSLFSDKKETVSERKLKDKVNKLKGITFKFEINNE